MLRSNTVERHRGGDHKVIARAVRRFQPMYSKVTRPTARDAKSTLRCDSSIDSTRLAEEEPEVEEVDEEQ